MDRALTRHGRVDARDLVRYEKEARKLFARFRRFVYNFYDPVFFEALLHARSAASRCAGPSRRVLAGGVEDPPLALKVWTQLMLWGIGIDRLRRRLGIGPKPVPTRREEPAA